MSEMIITVLASMGGSVVVLGGLFYWVGKRHLDRILQNEKQEHHKELV